MYLRKVFVLSSIFVLISAINAFAGDISWYEKNISSDVFEISTAQELKGLAELVNGDTSYGVVDFEGMSIELKNDIDLSDYENWEPIGNYETTQKCFRGTFTGNDNTITNLTVTKPTGYFVGLFGVLSGGYIEQVNIDNVNINITELGFERDDASVMAIGGIVGAVENGTVMICENLGGSITEGCDDITANDSVAGLIGISYGGYLSFNGNRATVSVANACGAGVACSIMGSSIGYSYNRGKITGGDSNRVAGICVDVDGDISCCYNNATVTGNTTLKSGICVSLSENTYLMSCIDFYKNTSKVYCSGSIDGYLYNENGGIEVTELTGAEVSDVVAYDMTTDEDEMLKYLEENNYYLSLRKAINADNLCFWWEALYSDKRFYGDVNCDGYFNDIDVAWVLKYIAGSKELDDMEKLQADFDENGAVNILDAIKLKQKYS